MILFLIFALIIRLPIVFSLIARQCYPNKEKKFNTFLNYLAPILILHSYQSYAFEVVLDKERLNTAVVVLENLALNTMSMFVMSTCCRMMSNSWKRFAVIFVHQILLLMSVVSLGARVDDVPFLQQMLKCFPSYIALVAGTVALLHQLQIFADRLNELSVNQMKRGLDMQQRVMSILDRLNVAVIELTEDLSRISFTNVAGFEFLKSAYQQSKNLNEDALPPQLQKNQFLKRQLQSSDSNTEEDK